MVLPVVVSLQYLHVFVHVYVVVDLNPSSDTEDPFHHVTRFADHFYVQYIQSVADSQPVQKLQKKNKEEQRIDLSQEFAMHTAKLFVQFERKYRSLSTSTSFESARMKAFRSYKLDKLLESYLIADCLTVLMLPLQQQAQNKYTSVLNALNGLNLDKFSTKSLIFVLLNRSMQIFHSKMSNSSGHEVDSSTSTSVRSSSSSSTSNDNLTSNPFISYMNGTIAANLFLADKDSRDIFYQLIVVAPLDLAGTESESKDSNGEQGFSLTLIGQTLIRLDDMVEKTVRTMYVSAYMYVCMYVE